MQTSQVKKGSTVKHTVDYLRRMGLLGKRGLAWQMKGIVLGMTHYPDYRTRCKDVVTVEWADGHISRVFPTMLERA